MVISEIMTREPVTAEATATVSEVMSALYELDIRHIPVTDDGELVGIVSDRDLRSFALPELVALDRPEEANRRLSAAVSEVMAGDVVALSSETDVIEAVDMMIEQKIGAVPVVAPGTRTLEGIVSYIDVLRAVRDLL